MVQFLIKPRDISTGGNAGYFLQLNRVESVSSPPSTAENWRRSARLPMRCGGYSNKTATIIPSGRLKAFLNTTGCQAESSTSLLPRGCSRLRCIRGRRPRPNLHSDAALRRRSSGSRLHPTSLGRACTAPESLWDSTGAFHGSEIPGSSPPARCNLG